MKLSRKFDCAKLGVTIGMTLALMACGDDSSRTVISGDQNTVTSNPDNENEPAATPISQMTPQATDPQTTDPNDNKAQPFFNQAYVQGSESDAVLPIDQLGVNPAEPWHEYLEIVTQGILHGQAADEGVYPCGSREEDGRLRIEVIQSLVNKKNLKTTYPTPIENPSADEQDLNLAFRFEQCNTAHLGLGVMTTRLSGSYLIEKQRNATGLIEFKQFESLEALLPTGVVSTLNSVSPSALSIVVGSQPAKNIIQDSRHYQVKNSDDTVIYQYTAAIEWLDTSNVQGCRQISRVEGQIDSNEFGQINYQSVETREGSWQNVGDLAKAQNCVFPEEVDLQIDVLAAQQSHLSNPLSDTMLDDGQTPGLYHALTHEQAYRLELTMVHEDGSEFQKIVENDNIELSVDSDGDGNNEYHQRFDTRSYTQAHRQKNSQWIEYALNSPNT